jgi:hypothetical protein
MEGTWICIYMYYFSMPVAVLGSNTSKFDLIYTGAERKIDGCVCIVRQMYTKTNTQMHTDAFLAVYCIY